MKENRVLTTSHGAIAVEENGAGSFPVLLIHGNSACRASSATRCMGGLPKDTASSHSTFRAMATSDAQIDSFARTSGAPYEPFLRAAVARTDGLAGKTMFEAFLSGHGVDQRQAVATNALPLAVVNGNDEPFVNLDYVDGLTYANLWERRCNRLPGLGHTPFWEAPEMFDPLFERFLHDVG